MLSTQGLFIPLLVVLPENADETAFGEIPRSVDMLIGPLRPLETRVRVRRLLEAVREQALAGTRADVTEQIGLDMVVGVDPAFVAVKQRLPLIAHTDATVLISGETGTGKEVAARAIHYLSSRSSAPFLPLNCGAIPTDLFENELFGHRRGAFTGAQHTSDGIIAEAERGTLFLDEVDTIPLPAQVKLLQFLQSKTFRPLGSGSLRRADVRVVAATNADLESKVKSRAFREDLYYRLNIIPLVMPALRERRADIGPLTQHFLAKHSPASHTAAWEFVPELLHVLEGFDWPGNVRELENVIQQIVALAPPGRVGLEMLPPRLRARTPKHAPASFREAKAHALASFEREYAIRLLGAFNGNVTRAAKAAQKDRRAFGRLIKKYAIRHQEAGPRQQ